MRAISVTRSGVTSSTRDAAGWKVGSDGIRMNNGKRFSLQLLYLNADTSKTTLYNKIVSDFKLSGIEIIPNEVKDKAAFDAALAAKNYDLYLGEIHLAPNMDISELLTGWKPAGGGLKPDSVILNSYNNFKNGSSDLETFLNDFDAEIPFYPLCYRSGIVAYSKTLRTSLHATFSDIFSNIEDVKIG
jgi:peptide/nickel transport system substrate-binding protein